MTPSPRSPPSTPEIWPATPNPVVLMQKQNDEGVDNRVRLMQKQTDEVGGRVL